MGFTVLSAWGGAGKGIKFINKAGKISDRAAGILHFVNNATATAYQADLFCESLENARAEMKAGSGKLSDIKLSTWVDMFVSGIGTAVTGRATLKTIPRHTPGKLKNILSLL